MDATTVSSHGLPATANLHTYSNLLAAISGTLSGTAGAVQTIISLVGIVGGSEAAAKFSECVAILHALAAGNPINYNTLPAAPPDARVLRAQQLPGESAPPGHIAARPGHATIPALASSAVDRNPRICCDCQRPLPAPSSKLNPGSPLYDPLWLPQKRCRDCSQARATLRGARAAAAAGGAHALPNASARSPGDGAVAGAPDAAAAAERPPGGGAPPLGQTPDPKPHPHPQA